MPRPDRYLVWGFVDGREIGPFPQPTSGAAKRTAHKMADQGATDIRVTDWRGQILLQDERDLVWADGDPEAALIKRRRMDGR